MPQEEKEIIVGSIVTIRLDPEKYCNSPLQKKQAEVVLIDADRHKDGPIGVKFPAWYEIAYPYFFDRPSFIAAKNVFNPDSIIHFQKEELSVDTKWRQPEISHENMCNLLFGPNMWHTYSKLKKPFLPRFWECMHEECVNKALFRILVNCWGVVSEYDVCPEHAVWHGRNCDEFPAKK